MTAAKANLRSLNMPHIEQKRIKTFLNTELKDYAKYVLETRTLPNIMDGLRTGARKILYAALTGEMSKRNLVKLLTLLGDTMKMQYAHGDASIASTIVNMCTDHTNKYHPFEANGQIPSLRVPNCDVASRYLMVRNTPYISLYKADFELLEQQIEEGEKIEPKFFLPIIPLVLLNRTGAPGFAFSFKSMSYRLEDVIDNCILSISELCSKGKTTFERTMLRPEIVGIKQENLIYNYERERWYSVGEYQLDFEKDIIKVTDLPHDVSFDNFEAHLNKLKDDYKIIEWSNMSEGENIKYFVKLAHGRLETLYKQNRWNFFKMFKLYSVIKPDILNCMDENGKTILFFDNPHDLIDAFVKKRLKYYDIRKKRLIKILEDNLRDYMMRIKFIQHVIDGTIVIAKRTKQEIIEQLNKHQIEPYVLDMKLWNLSQEKIDELNEKIKNTKKELDYIKRTSIEDMYLFDLVELRKNLCGIEKK